MKLVAEPIEAVRVTVRPLKNDDANPIESESDLKSATCSTRIVAEPIEVPRFTARPFRREATRPRESDRDLR